MERRVWCVGCGAWGTVRGMWSAEWDTWNVESGMWSVGIKVNISASHRRLNPN